MSEPTTSADELRAIASQLARTAEEYIVGELQKLRPHDAIVGEEGTDVAGTSGVEWHIDPIDGTANFLYDLPAWCTSIAAVDSDGSLAGAVYAPVTDELFSAHRNGGATLNGITIRASATDQLSVAMVGTGFSYLTDRRLPQARRIRELLPQVRDIRRFGSAALDLAFVACARLDAYFEEHLNSWDMAAGLLIASEAGALTSDLVGGTPDEVGVVAAAAGVHGALLGAIAAADGPSVTTS